jgi:hypothetical protein
MIPNASYPSSPNTANPAAAWQLTFSTRWDRPNSLFVFRDAGTSPEWVEVPVADAPALSPMGYCGSYRLVVRGSEVRAFVNDTLVYRGAAYGTRAEVAAYAQSFDRPITFGSLNVVLNLD